METIILNIFIAMIFGTICFLWGSLFVTRNNRINNKRTLRRNNNINIDNIRSDNMSNSNMGIFHGEINNRQNMESTKCYENGEIANLCVIIALKNIKRELNKILSPIEIDALNKAVDNTIIVEKLKAFIDNVELEDIDIDE